MTAQLLEYTTPSDARVRRAPARRTPPHQEVVHVDWAARQGRSCEVRRPASTLPATTRLVWTPRGVAVMVLLVAVVAGVMLTTVVGAFLAVSNEPAVPPVPVAAVGLSGPVLR